MIATGALVTLSPRDFDAALFDLDGVLTPTASVHAAAWKRLFDDALRELAAARGERFVPFDIDTDYRRYVDGRPRYDGVRAFLESRHIDLPEGELDEPPGTASMQALAGLKDQYFLEQLRRDGVEPYESSVALVRALREQGVRTGVVSSSRNCALVLETAGIASLFDVRVDGNDIERRGLKGKPAPDMFLEAAQRLKTKPRVRRWWKTRSPVSPPVARPTSG
jgi:HAD superfamily hydrolase (TIGR01509 family)